MVGHLFEAIVRAFASGESGGTFNHEGKSVRYERGYQVGLYGHELRFKCLDAREVNNVLEWLRFVQQDVEAGAFVGLWFDTDTKEYCLDVSVYISEYDRAMRWGKFNAQKAIWDWAKNESVTVV